jgi:hypothetical protein
MASQAPDVPSIALRTVAPVRSSGWISSSGCRSGGAEPRERQHIQRYGVSSQAPILRIVARSNTSSKRRSSKMPSGHRSKMQSIFSSSAPAERRILKLRLSSHPTVLKLLSCGHSHSDYRTCPRTEDAKIPMMQSIVKIKKAICMLMRNCAEDSGVIWTLPI